MVPLLVLLTVVVFLTIDFFVQKHRVRVTASTGAEAPIDLAAAPESIVPVRNRYPARQDPIGLNLFLDKSHQWLRIMDSGQLELGADTVAARALSDLIQVTLPVEGTQIRQGDSVVQLKSPRHSLTLKAPVSGKIEAVNSRVAEHPETLGEESWTQWLYQLKPERLGSALLADKLIGEDAREWLRTEYQQLRDHLTGLAHPMPEMALAQDGGVPITGYADDLDEEQWNELATRFFGESKEDGIASA